MLTRFIHQLLRLFYPVFSKLMPYPVYAYLVTGAINTLLNIGLFVACFQALSTNVFATEAATVVSFTITVVTGFWLQRNFAFNTGETSRRQSRQQFGKYALVALQGQLSAYLLTKGMIVFLHLGGSLAYILTACIMLTLNYFLQKYFTFRVKNTAAL